MKFVPCFYMFFSALAYRPRVIFFSGLRCALLSANAHAPSLRSVESRSRAPLFCPGTGIKNHKKAYKNILANEICTMFLYVFFCVGLSPPRDFFSGLRCALLSANAHAPSLRSVESRSRAPLFCPGTDIKNHKRSIKTFLQMKFAPCFYASFFVCWLIVQVFSVLHLQESAEAMLNHGRLSANGDAIPSESLPGEGA